MTARVDLRVRRGADYTHVLTFAEGWPDLAESGWQAVVRSPGGRLLFTPLVDATAAASRVLTLRVSSEVTAALAAGRAPWMLLDGDGEVLVSGYATADDESTGTETSSIPPPPDGEEETAVAITVQGVPVPGAGGSVDRLELVAGGTLSGHRLVTTDEAGHAVYADPSDETRAAGPWFLTTGAVMDGATFQPAVPGEVVEESGWAWEPQAPVFLGDAGALTASPPAAGSPGIVLRVGVALTPTRLYFAPAPSIIRGA